MSAIISTVLATSGLSQACAHIRNNSGLIWDNVNQLFEGYNVSDYSFYCVQLFEQGNTGYYQAPFPSAIPAGIYSYTVYPDFTPGSQAINTGVIDWNGSQENYVGLIVAKLPSGQISGFDSISETVNLGSNQSGVTVGTTNNLGTGAAASVYTQVNTAIGSDAIAELTGVPSSTPTLKTALMFLFMALRNKRTSTNTTVTIANNSGAQISNATQSDDGTTYTKNNFT